MADQKSTSADTEVKCSNSQRSVSSAEGVRSSNDPIANLIDGEGPESEELFKLALAVYVANRELLHSLSADKQADKIKELTNGADLPDYKIKVCQGAIACLIVFHEDLGL